MTPRERLFAALAGQETDRVPVWLLFPYHPTGYYADVRCNPCYRSIFEASRDRAIMLNRRNLGVRLFTPEVSQTREHLTEDGWDIERATLRYHAQMLVSEVRRRGSETQTRRLLDTEEALRLFSTLPVDLDPDSIRRQLDAQLPRYLQERAEFPEAYGAMMLDLGEPVGVLYHQSNLEEYAIWSLTCPGLVRRTLDRLMVQRREVYRYCLERELADVYFLVGSELASPPLVSRATFRDWILPQAQELIALIHSYGKRVIQHYHGQIREILPDFVEMAPDGLHTIEAPPTGNCTLTEAYGVVGDRITLIGNIQYDCFRAYTPQEMEAAVHRVIAECRGHRFILSPTAGPYEPEIPPRMIENYLAFLRAAWETPVGGG